MKYWLGSGKANNKSILLAYLLTLILLQSLLLWEQDNFSALAALQILFLFFITSYWLSDFPPLCNAHTSAHTGTSVDTHMPCL